MLLFTWEQYFVGGGLYYNVLTSRSNYYYINTYNQISTASGFMKENNRVGFPLGILKRIEIPRFMKGFVKSMTSSLAKFIVMAPIAMSALPSINSERTREYYK